MAANKRPGRTMKIPNSFARSLFARAPTFDEVSNAITTMMKNIDGFGDNMPLAVKRELMEKEIEEFRKNYNEAMEDDGVVSPAEWVDIMRDIDITPKKQIIDIVNEGRKEMEVDCCDECMAECCNVM